MAIGESNIGTREKKVFWLDRAASELIRRMYEARFRIGRHHTSKELLFSPQCLMYHELRSLVYAERILVLVDHWTAKSSHSGGCACY